MSFTIIACVGKNLELGAGGDLVFHIPEDMKFFRSQTMGHRVVMGRKTYESLPPAGLPGREMVVLSRSEGLNLPHASIISNILDFVKSTPDNEEVFVIGGGAIYAQFLPFASRMLLTEVDAEFDGADTYFPKFEASGWTRRVLKKGSHDGVDYEFVEYIKK